MVRAHNAEFPHAVDKARAIFRNRFFMSRKAKINALCVALLQSVKTLCLDFKTARSSDHLLSCSLLTQRLIGTVFAGRGKQSP